MLGVSHFSGEPHCLLEAMGSGLAELDRRLATSAVGAWGPCVIGILEAMRPGRSVVAGILSWLALTGCAGASSGASSRPPAGAPASVVLDTYLRDLVAGDCTAARVLATSTFSFSNGELCGHVKVSAFSVNADPATPAPDESVFAEILTTESSSDGAIAAGKTTRFYDLKHQVGEWKLVSGGSGP